VWRQDVHVREYASPLASYSGSSNGVAEEWEKAQVDFFEAFRNYDEAGSSQRTQVLKYLVLAHMLMGSKINPFDSQEIKPCAHALRPRDGH
jgi:hypothetical protein